MQLVGLLQTQQTDKVTTDHLLFRQDSAATFHELDRCRLRTECAESSATVRA
jgi:hypothetical protein